MNKSGYDFIVLGGGIAGLSVALEILRAGASVAIIEKADLVGGLAQTMVHQGYRFDVGGHRFHSNNYKITDWLRNLLGHNLQWVERSSHILLRREYIPYPLKFPRALTAFSPSETTQMLVSYLAARLRYSENSDDSFEDWVIRRFGRRLFEIYFQPYTEKVWGLPCDQISAQWAEQRIGLPSLRKAIVQSVFPARQTPATAVTRFLYPRRGFGMIHAALEKKILAVGGRLLTGFEAIALQPSKTGFSLRGNTAAGVPETLAAKHLISTIPVGALLRILDHSATPNTSYNLPYRGLIIVKLAIAKPQIRPDTWVYFPENNYIFGRIHEPKNWSAEMVPNPDTTSLVAEIFSSPGAAHWQTKDSEIEQLVVRQLATLGWITPQQVIGCWVSRFPYAYPVYRIGYERELAKFRTALNQIDGLHLLGRTGSFRYSNTDGVLEDVFAWMTEHFPATHKIPPLLDDNERWA